MKNLTSLIGVFLSVKSFTVAAQTPSISDLSWMEEAGNKFVSTRRNKTLAPVASKQETPRYHK